MRIVFLSQVLPLPLDAGPKVRSYHVIRYLAEAGHEVHLLSFTRKGDAGEHVEALRRLCASVGTVPLVRSRVRDLRDGVRSVLSAMPFLVLRDQIGAMRQALQAATASRSFDALHADQLWMAPYAMNGLAAGLTTVLDQHNAVFMVPQRLANHQKGRVARTLLRHEADKLQAFERDACRRFDRVVWVTEQDRKAVLPSSAGAGDGSRDAIIPIAADPVAQRRIERPRPFRVTFLGGLHWPPNREGVAWFIDRVWPRIANAVPAALLTVIGRHDAAISRLSARQPRVEVTGYIAEPRPYLAETAVFVVPLRSGAGMRVKILDAWCWGLPIVSTAVGAEGLKGVHGENLLIADDEEAFAGAVTDLLTHPRAAQRLADGGRRTVEAHYDWRTVYTAWDAIYRRPNHGQESSKQSAEMPDVHPSTARVLDAAPVA